VAVVEGAGPEGMGDGAGGPLDECLSEEGGAGPAPVDPMFVAAALSDGRDADALLDGGCVGEAVALLAERGQEARREHGTSARKIGEEAEVRERLATLGDVGVEAGDAGGERAKLWEQRGDDGEGGLDDGRVGGQRTLGLNGVDALVDDGGAPDAVGVEEGDEGVATGALDGLQRRPALEEGREDVGLLVAKPVDDLREVVLEGEGETVGDADAVLDEVAACLDEASEGAHVLAVAAKRRELLGVTTEELEGEGRVGRIVLGPAGDEGTTVLGERAGVDGEDDEESYSRSAETIGPWASSTHTAMGRPPKRSRRRRAHASMTVGRCSSTEASGLVAPGTCRQTSCLRSAQSIPTKAANLDASSCMETSSI